MGWGKEDQRGAGGALVSVSSGMSPPEMGFTPSQLGPLFVLTFTAPGQRRASAMLPAACSGGSTVRCIAGIKHRLYFLVPGGEGWRWWMARRASLAFMAWLGK